MKIKRTMAALLSLVLLSTVLILPSGCTGGGSNMYVSFKTYEDVNTGVGKGMTFTNSELNVVSNYNDEFDFVMVMEMMGNNNIFNIQTPYTLENVGDKPNSDVESKVLFGENQGESDWCGPYKVAAQQNEDGDRKMGEFTGGNHDYLNGSGGSVTGRTDSVTLYVNGKEIKGDYEGYADEIDVYWVNYIQGSNTKKIDGSGREILKEMYHAHYAGDNAWHIDQQMEFLEDSVILCYYGMQAINQNWEGEVKFGADGEWLPANKTCQSSSDNEDTITLRKNDNYLQLKLDTTYGLGQREYMKNKSKTGFVEVYGEHGKSYFYIVEGYNKFSAGTIDGWRGTYTFSYGTEPGTEAAQ